ncbi:MAG: GNAT family N-acetyltransferase [Cyclobacteriaceae bacterium]
MIRKYQKSDLSSVYNIWLKASTIAHPFLEKAFVEKVKADMLNIYIPNSDTWVYEVKGAILGFIGMHGNEIGGLFVDPQSQSQGIGTQLVDYISQSYNELEVEVFKKNRIGRPFYEKYGFILINESMHEESNQVVFRMKYRK